MGVGGQTLCIDEATGPSRADLTHGAAPRGIGGAGFEPATVGLWARATRDGRGRSDALSVGGPWAVRPTTDTRATPALVTPSAQDPISRAGPNALSRPPAHHSIQPAANRGARISSWLDADRKSTSLNSSHANISYAVLCL